MKSKSPEYMAWKALRARCLNPNHKQYRSYGGKGIGVCDSWKRSFSEFLRDMGPRPTSEHSIDRYPNNRGGYAPDNCRWATQKEQCRNKTNNVLLTVQGETLCAAGWAERSGMAVKLILQRIKRNKWSPEKAIFAPPSAPSRGGQRQ